MDGTAETNYWLSRSMKKIQPAMFVNNQCNMDLCFFNPSMLSLPELNEKARKQCECQQGKKGHNKPKIKCNHRRIVASLVAINWEFKQSNCTSLHAHRAAY